MKPFYYARSSEEGKWAVFFQVNESDTTFVCSHATEGDANLIADLLNRYRERDNSDDQLREENQKLRDYLDNVRTGKGRPVAPGIERTLLIALLRRARDFLPGVAGDPSIITDEMLDPEESGTLDARRAQLALDIEHAYELLEIDS